MVLRDKGDLDGAITDYSKAIEIFPQLTGAYYGRGSALRDKGDLDGAIADYSKAIEIKPIFTDAYYARGRALEGKERPTKFTTKKGTGTILHVWKRVK